MRSLRPFSARTPEFQQKIYRTLSSDARLRNIRNNQEITEEEIFIMRQELEALLREKSLLKNKIMKLMNNEQSKNGFENFHKRSIENEIEELQKYIRKKNDEMENLQNSEPAAQVTEMQEEIVILYEEMQRLNEMKRQIDAMVKDATANLDQTIKAFSPEALSRNSKTIHNLQKQIEIQKQKNQQARENLEKKENEPNTEEIEHAKYVMESSIKILEQSIQDEEKEIDSITQEIDRIQQND